MENTKMDRMIKLGKFFFILLVIASLFYLVLFGAFSSSTTYDNSVLIILILILYSIYTGNDTTRILVITTHIIMSSLIIISLIVNSLIKRFLIDDIVYRSILASIGLLIVTILNMPIFKQYLLYKRVLYLQDKIDKMTRELKTIEGYSESSSMKPPSSARPTNSL